MKGKRHHGHHKAHGGEVKTGSGEVKEAGGNPYVEEEAEKKRGGKVKKHKARKRGGRIHGAAAHKHLGHRGRKRGGKTGADLAPLSSASKPSGIGHQAPVQSERKSPD